jgi:hypothetical protein
MVNAILDSFLNMGHGTQVYNLATGAVGGSVRGNQFGIFRMVFDILSERVGVNTIPKLLRHAIWRNAPQHYLEYGLNRIRNHLRRPGASAMPEDWYDTLVDHFIKARMDDGGQRLETFKFLLRQPEWNPGTISNLLDTAEESFNSGKIRFTSQLLRELRETRRTFLDSDGNQMNGGIGALSSAISEAQSDRSLQSLVDMLLHQRELARYAPYLDR